MEQNTKIANSAGPKWLETIPTIWLVFDFSCLQLTFTKLQVDYAQAESWKKEGMNVPTECKNGCVYQMEGDDSGKFHSKHIFDEFEYLKFSIHSGLPFLGTVYCFAMGDQQVTCNDARHYYGK